VSRTDAMANGAVLGLIAGLILALAVAGPLPYARHGLSVVLLLLSVPLCSWAGARFALCSVGLRELPFRMENERRATECVP
jgi:hypothetical protein